MAAIVLVFSGGHPDGFTWVWLGVLALITTANIVKSARRGPR